MLLHVVSVNLSSPADGSQVAPPPPPGVLHYEGQCADVVLCPLYQREHSRRVLICWMSLFPAVHCFFVMLAVDFGMLVNLHHCFYTGLLNLFYSFIKMRFEFFIYLR